MNIKSKTFIKASLILVYFWFGFLKILGLSPVADLIKQTYPTFPSSFVVFLGLWEILIALFLINKKTVKIGVILIWIHLGGIFMGALINPSVYFTNSNFLSPNTYGEFVIKNFVIIASSYSLIKE